MNIREKYKKETYKEATMPYKFGRRFTADYTEWLEQRIYAIETENNSLLSRRCNCINGIPQSSGGCPIHGIKF